MGAKTASVLGVLLAFASVSAAEVGLPRKKCISFGWEYQRVTPAQLLANADKFKDTFIDGVGIYLRTTNRFGRTLSSAAIMTSPEWDIRDFDVQIPYLSRIAKTEHLSESFVKCFCAPVKRVPWTDDAAWKRIAHNMGVMGQILRKTGLRGISPDTEDYPKQKQYVRLCSDPPYDELVKIVRRRGREAFGPLFKECPEAVVLFYWFLTMEMDYLDSPDPLTQARIRQDLWPAFADGIMDVLPPQARIVDGNEHYSLEYFRSDFHASACRQRMLAHRLLSPENWAKHREQVQVSFALYLDMYVNPGPRHYRGPVFGSRLEHFRRNCADAFKLADEYVWMWGEHRLTVHWDGVSFSPSLKSRETWAEALPGLYPAMRAMHDPDYSFRLRRDDLAAKGQLEEMVSNPECRPDANSAKGGLPAPFKVYKGQGEPVFRLAEGVGDGDDSCIAVSGMVNGVVLVTFHDCGTNEAYEVTCRMKGGVPRAYIGWRDGKRNWRWDLGKGWLDFSPPDATGWQTGRAFVELPSEARGFSVGLCPKVGEGETVLIDNVHVKRLPPWDSVPGAE